MGGGSCCLGNGLRSSSPSRGCCRRALWSHCCGPCRYLFWTEWGQYPRIERSRLDGTERMVLVNVSISWPNGISVDYEVCGGVARSAHGGCGACGAGSCWTPRTALRPSTQQPTAAL